MKTQGSSEIVLTPSQQGAYDVIFESGAEHGLYRYLLTMLDGLESESAARVCVMMTAMDVGNLPPALIRSGRVELWLEMRLPNRQARTQILRDLFTKMPAQLQAVDLDRLADATESFTGADLRRLSNDGKALYAFDLAGGEKLKSVTQYFLDAATDVAQSKEKYAEAESRARVQRPVRPPWFDAVDLYGYESAEDDE